MSRAQPAGWERAGSVPVADDDGPEAQRRRLVLLAAGLVLLLLAVTVALLAVEHRDRRRLADVQRTGGPALTAAADAARVLFSYDASRLDADLAAALPLTTGAYTARYRDGTQQVLWPAARQDGSVVSADVREVGATRSTTADRLVALVLLDRTTSRTGAAPVVDSEQLRMTLVEQGGRWRVSGVEQL